MTQSGWRKPTPGLGAAQMLAQAGEQISIPKTTCVVNAKRVGAHIGLKAADLMLLDTLAAFTQPQDWEQGRRPIVWASNAYLMHQTGFSLSALKRHARRLAEAGVTAFRDSPNGKRWGHRDADGQIVEAYGFDLSPLAARAEEFAVLYAELTAERTLCQRLKRQITISRRMVRARLEMALTEALSGPWGHLQAAFEALLLKLPRGAVPSSVLAALLEQFQRLQHRIETRFEAAGQGAHAVDEVLEPVGEVATTKKMDPNRASSDPHIPITKHLHSVICNPSEKEGAANVGTQPERSDKTERSGNIDLATLMQACPEFAEWARNLGGYVRDWADLDQVAGQLRPMIGVSEPAWEAARRHLGALHAAIAFALIFDKFQTGEVSSPGGYLRGMIERHKSGSLHLDRSLYGRLGRQAA